jgi:predicted exporter
MFVIVLAVLFLFLRPDSLWNDDLASLSPIPKSDQLLDEQLRRDVGAPDVRYLIVINADDQESALEASENMAATLQRLTQQGLLEDFESPALYLPSLAAQRARQAALPNPQALRANLQQALRKLPFRPGLFEPFLHDMETTREQSLLDRNSLSGTHFALKLDSLLVKSSKGWTAMLPLRGVTDPEIIAREVGAVRGASAALIDLRRESDQLYKTYRHEAISHSLLGVAVIALFLLATLRSPRRVFNVLAPLAAAVIVTSSILLLAVSKLSIFHLIGLLLVVAVGSNYSLFFDRQAVSNQDRERTLASLLFANISTVIGFGVLSFSKVPVLNAIGSTVGIGAILSLVFSAILITREPRRAAV